MHCPFHLHIYLICNYKYLSWSCCNADLNIERGIIFIERSGYTIFFLKYLFNWRYWFTTQYYSFKLNLFIHCSCNIIIYPSNEEYEVWKNFWGIIFCLHVRAPSIEIRTTNKLFLKVFRSRAVSIHLIQRLWEENKNKM